MVSAATGRLTKKNQRQPSRSVRAPPTRGPTAEPAAPMAAQIAKARPRRPSGKTSPTIESGLVENSATARPCTQRPAMSTPMLGARPHMAEPSANRRTPTRSTLRRPTRSPSRPKAMSGAISARLNPLTVHCSAVVPAPNASPIEGSATVMP